MFVNRNSQVIFNLKAWDHVSLPLVCELMPLDHFLGVVEPEIASSPQ